MSRVHERKWSEGTGECDFALRAHRCRVEVLLPGMLPALGRKRWSVVATCRRRESRWEVIEVPEGTVVVSDVRSDDTVTRSRVVQAWRGPSDIARFPVHLVGSSLRAVEQHLLVGLAEPCALFSILRESERERGTPRFARRPTDALDRFTLARFALARRLFLIRAGEPPDSIEDRAPAGCAAGLPVGSADRPAVGEGLHWRTAFPARVGARQGVLVLELADDRGPPDRRADVAGWFSPDEPELALVDPVPGMALGSVAADALSHQ